MPKTQEQLAQERDTERGLKVIQLLRQIRESERTTQQLRKQLDEALSAK